MKQYIKGLQHIGIPTTNFAGTLEFYLGLGFDLIMQTKNQEDDVAFLRFGNLTIETYTGSATGMPGAIHHIALDVTDIQSLFDLTRQNGYRLMDDQIHSLAFWENGVRYFMIEGPNGEHIEFNQIL